MDSNVSSSLMIVSGGQTGADRAALDVAIELGIPHGGWCPQGRRAEDGKIDARYALRETTDTDYVTRTKLNVRDADGTLILNSGKLEGGTAATVQFAKELNKPCLIVDLHTAPQPKLIIEWLENNKIRILNIAGPRESKRPGVYRLAREFLWQLFSGNYLKINSLPLDGGGWDGGEILNKAETQPPSQPSPCQGEGAIVIFSAKKAGK